MLGGCLDCLGLFGRRVDEDDERSDPLLDAEARRLAAEAAERRQRTHEDSVAGRATRKAKAVAERERREDGGQPAMRWQVG
mmetsp:Transcript_8034/g.21165  ORF Transcript_8034/g.21165 Transcript_8034/m.21165 type:complete len:81 (-) Transcript_8034:242-484(-)